MTDRPRSFVPIDVSDLPYLDKSTLTKRIPVIIPYHDGVDWHIWTQRADKKLQPLAVIDQVEGLYLSRISVSKDDVFLAFVEWVLKHITDSSMLGFYGAIEDDILNLCTCLHKLETLHAAQWTSRTLSTRAVRTDLEYVTIACRALFDLMQEFIGRIWHAVRLHDSRVVKQRLPTSFGDMCLSGGKKRTTHSIESKYGLPAALSEYYARWMDFFINLRAARDAIVHQPRKAPLVFDTPNGFAIVIDEEPFSTIATWKDSHLLPNRLGSLRYWIATCIQQTIDACEDLSDTMQRCFEFPPDFAPGFHVFVRSPSVGVLHRLESVTDGDPWSKLVSLASPTERTSLLAYELWRREGAPSGRELDHWFTAERLLGFQTTR